ncbi:MULTISPECIES: Rha family transcriptional regulator [Bacillus]|uniref:Rha family transcriptional regulator n=1 Tax=Bacillus TaxID=1386 RepID=UPI000206EEB6|nr:MULTISPECIES: phage antirepressor KilAC domain-containing protein [Bacillus amyloliquefaciens group]AEB63865.1 SPBc2 prophage-derived putative antirepressor protein yoqD [Bacillus amyloliquefaciens LL3]MBG9464194.1 DNA-binding protein [Bacillus amyloliquefaciens]MCV2523180.1 phage antirepressor KilAC domain-containing protein [Bacillus velezensis]MEC0385887.1 phage antirepressor KilAC domain-containing protein [Bacillus velezensis]MEC0403200.1 phage antirepressor KilAC domain-containing pro
MEKNLTVIERDGQLLMDSREVADMVGKEHKEFLRTIHNHIQILESAELRSQDFYIKDHYKTEGNNKSYKYYLLTRKGCDMVANKMNGTKGVLFTAHYVTRFEEMETQLKKQLVPSYMIDNSIQRAERWIQEQKERERIESEKLLLEQQVTEYQPKVEKYHQFLDADGLMDIGSLAKELNIKGFGRNKLFTFLKDQKILMANNLPYQKYMGRGLFEVKSVPTSKIGYVSKTYLTAKGADYITDLISKRKPA